MVPEPTTACPIPYINDTNRLFPYLPTPQHPIPHDKKGGYEGMQILD
jgi:hypothetical protein